MDLNKEDLPTTIHCMNLKICACILMFSKNKKNVQNTMTIFELFKPQTYSGRLTCNLSQFINDYI